MKRSLVFLVAAPVLVAVMAWLMFMQINGPAERSVANFLAVILFIFTVPVSAVTALLDEFLARAFPLLLRLPMTAAIGATASVGLAFVLFSELLAPGTLQYFALGGAAVAGLCSLLANDHARALASMQGNSLLRNG